MLGVVAASPAAAHEAAREAVKEGECQADIPGGDKPMAGTIVRRERDGGEVQGPSLFGRIANVLLWVLAIGAAAVGAFWLINELAQRLEPALDPAEIAAQHARHEGVVERPLGDAEALARAGKYAEAIHTLLLRTLSELRAVARHPIPRSLTSREIVARVSLQDEARQALRGLVDAVEITHFGDVIPGATEYDACVAHFHSFANAYRRGA